MAAAHLIVALHEHIVPRVQKEHIIRHIQRVKRRGDGGGGVRKQALAAVDGDRRLLDCGRGVIADVDELLQHGGGKIIDAKIALLLQTTKSK